MCPSGLGESVSSPGTGCSRCCLCPLHSVSFLSEWWLCQELPKFLDGKRASKSISHPSAFVHSIWVGNIQGGLNPRAQWPHISKFWRERKLNYQITSGCISGSRSDMGPWWPSCTPKGWALKGFSKFWDKTKFLTRWATRWAMLMTRSKGKGLSHRRQDRRFTVKGGHLLAQTKSLGRNSIIWHDKWPGVNL